VARNLFYYFGSTTLVSNPVGGQSVVLAFAEQRLYGVILLTLDHALIKKIHVIADPAKIDLLASRLSAASSGGGR
jgi:hypothetical protein